MVRYASKRYFAADDWRRYQWLGMALQRGDSFYDHSHHVALHDLMQDAHLFVPEFDSGQCSVRIIFELGAALRHADKREETRQRVRNRPLVKRCVELHTRWVALAKGAIECWIAVARRLGVAKDVRRLVAELAWKDQAAWCGK
jgi:hypothetical protein